ncbi:MAG: hypothetical protein U0744_07775 [Gemmataceae bacterium]
MLNDLVARGKELGLPEAMVRKFFEFRSTPRAFAGVLLTMEGRRIGSRPTSISQGSASSHRRFERDDAAIASLNCSRK